MPRPRPRLSTAHANNDDQLQRSYSYLQTPIEYRYPDAQSAAFHTSHTIPASAISLSTVAESPPPVSPSYTQSRSYAFSMGEMATAQTVVSPSEPLSAAQHNSSQSHILPPADISATTRAIASQSPPPQPFSHHSNPQVAAQVVASRSPLSSDFPHSQSQSYIPFRTDSPSPAQRVASPTHQQPLSPINNPPPLSEHPAQFAPVAADSSSSQNQTTRSQPAPQFARYPTAGTPHTQATDVTPQPPQPSAAPIPQPSSPGPLPVKHNPATEPQNRQEKKISIAPDSNPLAPTSTRGSTFPFASPSATNGVKSNDPSSSSNHFPGQTIHPAQMRKGGSWTHGLCDCRDVGVCCTGLWCPCILYGRTQYRLSRRSEGKDPTNMLGFETCNASCTAMALLCGCQWLLSTIQHSRTRRAYDIPGDITNDCVRATFCMCCALIQDEREIKVREEGYRQTVSLPYMTPADMSFEPPPRGLR